MTGLSNATPRDTLGPFTRCLLNLARASAVAGGLLMVGILLVTCFSVIGRNLWGATLVGDFELTAVACGVAVACFLPWCQWRRGHILVDFFTAHASPHVRAGLDRLGAGAMAACLLCLAWRTGIGGLNAHANFASSMLLGVPHWWVYAGMVPPLVLAAVIALSQALSPEPGLP